MWKLGAGDHKEARQEGPQSLTTSLVLLEPTFLFHKEKRPVFKNGAHV